MTKGDCIKCGKEFESPLRTMTCDKCSVEDSLTAGDYILMSKPKEMLKQLKQSVHLGKELGKIVETQGEKLKKLEEYINTENFHSDDSDNLKALLKIIERKK